MPRAGGKSKIRSIGEFFDEDTIAHYQLNPVDFVYDVIFHEDSVFEGGELYLSDQQCEVLMALADPEVEKVSVVSGKGFGKTALLSFCVLWFITCYGNPKIALTAPSFPQLKSALWPEVAKWLNRSLIKDLFEYTTERLYYKVPKEKDNWWAEPRTAAKKENMQGLHADNMLLIIDEGSGVDDEIYEALDTTMTAEESLGVNKMITVGNGTKTDGFFYDSHHTDKDEWAHFSYSSIDSPFVDNAKMQKLIEKYGWDHDIVRVSVRGKFPLGNPDSFIPLNLVEAAMMRDVKKTDDIHIGVDVARFGDDLTVLTWREGLYVHPQISKGRTSVNDVVDMVKALVRQIRKETGSKRRIPVKIDDTGVGGGVTDYLRLENDLNIEVIPVNFANKPMDTDLYQNTPSEIWGAIKDRIHEISLPYDDNFLCSEIAARKFKIPNGKILIQTKSDFKIEYKGSPDKADSLGLCLYEVQNVRSVLTSFDRFNPNVVRDNIEYTDAMRKVISLWYSKETHVSMVLGAYDGFRLHILDEYAGDDNIYQINHFINNYARDAIIIGNNIMFADGMSVHKQFRKIGTKVNKNRKYEEVGAIQNTNAWIKSNRIVLSKRCGRTIEQLGNWNVEEAQKMLEIKYGNCYAITNLVSYLKESAFSPYTPQPMAEEYKEKKSNSVLVNPITKWFAKR